ncbi:MAG: hypothetical protein HN936_19925, partial [Bacteroidetes bacterium]|nr:hypothetical protein [Bacteroidota bacterium]
MKTITKLLPAVITAIIILLSSQSGISQQSDFFKKYSQAKLEISKEIASNPELRDDREKSKEYARSQIRELYASKALDIEAWLPDRGERDRFKPITNSASSTTQVDEGDLQALTDLYNQCNGAGWVNNENWLDGDPSTWYGVSLNGEGRVAGLRLPQNNLTGELPSSFSNLTALQDLLLPNNFLEGTLPASWSVWSSIEYFELRNNNFSGNLPESWSDWTSIKRLLLGSNQIEGTLPESWGLMSSLEIIELGHNPINGTIPISWANLSQLQFIMLDWTNLGGELPREWSNLTNLEHIILGGNQFEGTLPVEWANLQNIIQISVFWNNLNGELPNEWSSLNNLEYLNLGGNYFSGLLPAGWSSLTMLRSISIEDNELIGELPASWALFSQLEYLDLSNNLLSGSLPGSWGDLGNILNINLSSNSLEGGIPHEWNSSQFHSVLLGYNELSGEIPLSWTLNENLMYLGISENRFSVLPDFSASNLTDLWVRSNNLDFADLIPNMGILIEDNSRYIPQKAFGEVEYLALPMGQAFSKFFEVAGEGNLYQWHLNWEEVEGATNAELFINSIDLTNQGVYFLHVTNPAVPDLVLESNGVTLEVIVPDAEITQFEFSYTDCGCNLNTIIDPDNSLITVEVPFTLDISNLAPSFIEIPEGAFVSPEVGVPQDWSNGPINYAVTEEGGAGVWTWTIDVQPWACQEKNILGLSFPEDPVASVIVDEGTSMINITAQEGVDLSSILVQFELPCGASLNYSGQTVINTILFDFSSELNQVFNVVAQDGSTQSWEILLTVKNLPIVSFGGGEAQNCSTGITFSSDKNGWLAIVHEDAIENGQPIFNLATEDGRNQLQWEQFGNWAEFFVAWETAEVSLEWIRPGTYYAFAMDQLGNTSVISEETLVLTPCLRVVNDLTELRNTSAIFQFEISGEIVVSYEEHPAGDYAFKYAQDENAGMKIVDRNNILPDSYGLGTGLTGLKGFLEHTGDEFIFIPTELPDQSSTGNVISPVELIYDDYREQCYYNNAYESMLVRIITPIKAFDDYGTGKTLWELDYLDLATITAIGDYDWFVQKVFNADYIGLEIPTEPTVYQGIRTNVDWWGGKYGLITPRSLADMISVTDPILNVEPRLVVFNEILVGQCEQNQVELINSGIGSLTINSLALIGPDADNFTIENAPAEGASINSWESLFFDIHFCKQVAGEKNVSVVVNYNDNLLYELPVLGSALTINAVPHCTSFEDDGSDRNGWILSNENVFYAHWQSTSGAFSLGMRRAGDKFAESPAFEITGAYPTLQFNEGSIYTGCYDTRQVLISNDFKQSWQVVAEYSASELPEVYLENNPFMKRQISLEAYNGSTIFVKLQSLDDDPNRDAYWLIDDFCIGDESLSFDQEFLEISGTIPGVCSTSHAYIINSGIISTSITSIEITPESSSDYSVSNLPELP